MNQRNIRLLRVDYIYVYAARAFWQAMVAAIIKGLPT